MMSADVTPKSSLTLANRITILRILGIPFFALVSIYYLDSPRADATREWYRLGALVLFVAIALTDALDGYFARSRGEITRLGRVLDPIADKALLLTAVVLFTRPSQPEFQPQLPVYLTAAVISRDVILLLGAALIHYFTGTVEVQPRWIGKLTTVLLMLAIVWTLAGGPRRPFVWLCAATTACTILSGLRYIVDGIRQIERMGAGR